MQKIHEGVQALTALRASTNVTSLTGPYFSFEKYRKGLFLLTISGQTNAESLVFAVYEAKDRSGTGAAQLGASVTLAQGSKVTAAQIVCTGVHVGDTVKIKPYTFVSGVLTAGTELTFTAAAAESLANRQFDQSGADAACATSLAACINNATYGVPGITASVDTVTVTLTVTDDGEGAMDVTELAAAAAARLVVTDLEQSAWFEVEADELTSGFTHAGARVSSVDAATEFSCVLLRALPRYAPVGQPVTAYDDSE